MTQAISNMIRKFKNNRAWKREQRQIEAVWAIAEDEGHPRHNEVWDDIRAEQETQEEYERFQQGIYTYNQQEDNKMEYPRHPEPLSEDEAQAIVDNDPQYADLSQEDKEDIAYDLFTEREELLSDRPY